MIIINPRHLTVDELCAIGECLCRISAHTKPDASTEAMRTDIRTSLKLIEAVLQQRAGVEDAADGDNVVSLFGGR